MPSDRRFDPRHLLHFPAQMGSSDFAVQNWANRTGVPHVVSGATGFEAAQGQAIPLVYLDYASLVFDAGGLYTYTFKVPFPSGCSGVSFTVDGAVAPRLVHTTLMARTTIDFKAWTVAGAVAASQTITGSLVAWGF